MRSKEWPLIIFTIAIQIAVGAFVLLWSLYPFLAGAAGQLWADHFTGLLLVAIVVVLVLGGLAATLHLGNPVNAYLALSNWRSSWLSREMLLGMLFGGLVSLFAVLHWLGINSAPIRLALGGLTSLGGLTLVFGMARLYMLRTVPAWNTPATPIAFFATTFLLGGLTHGVCLTLTSEIVHFENILHFLGMLALLMLDVQLITFALHPAHLSGQGGAAAISVRRLGVDYGRLATARLVLAGVGVGIFVAYAFQGIPLPGLATLGLGLVLLAEVMGRFLFYESMVRIGCVPNFRGR